VKRISSKVVHEGPIATVREEKFRHSDGSESEREVVGHPGSVAVLAHDGEHLYLVRQPREAVEDESLLELPAGKLDVPGESELECAQRELGEEIGKAAAEWRELKRLYTSPGFSDEEVTIYLATGLSDADAEPDDTERIEIVRWPLSELGGAIAECRDAKSVVGLMLLRDLRRSGDA
jgi:8-oxo-dGTP pyrophosphatase MutT (NUDIX family)